MSCWHDAKNSASSTCHRKSEIIPKGRQRLGWVGFDVRLPKKSHNFCLSHTDVSEVMGVPPCIIQSEKGWPWRLVLKQQMFKPIYGDFPKWDHPIPIPSWKHMKTLNKSISDFVQKASGKSTLRAITPWPWFPGPPWSPNPCAAHAPCTPVRRRGRKRCRGGDG